MSCLLISGLVGRECGKEWGYLSTLLIDKPGTKINIMESKYRRLSCACVKLVCISFPLTGFVRRCLPSSYHVRRQVAHQHHAGDHQAEHGEAHPGIRAAIPQGYDAQGRPSGGLRHSVPGEADRRPEGGAQGHVMRRDQWPDH